jgi:hypothetical protein
LSAGRIRFSAGQIGAAEGFHRDQNRLSKSPLSWSIWRSQSLSAFACTEYKPCFQFARLDRANPSGVRGPVLAPPCIRQRPLRIADARHFFARRVLAPHLGAVFGSPGELPFFNQLDFSPFRLFVSIITTGILRLDLSVHLTLSNNSLPTLVDMDVFDDHFLLTFTPITP